MVIRMQKINPFLWFDDQAEDAAKLYVSIFKNSKIAKVTRYPEEAAEKIGRPAGSVMTVEFTLDGVELYLGSSRRARPLPRGFSGHVAHPFSLHSSRSWGHPRKSAARIDFYFMKGGPPDGQETYANRRR